MVAVWRSGTTASWSVGMQDSAITDELASVAETTELEGIFWSTVYTDELWNNESHMCVL